MLLHQSLFFFFVPHIQKFNREPIKYRSSIFFPPLLPSPHLPPTRFLSELSSVMGWEGVARRGGDGVYWCYWLELLIRSEGLVSSGQTSAWTAASVIADSSSCDDDALPLQCVWTQRDKRQVLVDPIDPPLPPTPSLFSLTQWPPW